MTELQNGLYPHQVDGIKFLTQHGRAILADDMGLGKTRQAVIDMNEAAPNGVVLVICPASLKAGNSSGSGQRRSRGHRRQRLRGGRTPVGGGQL